MPDDEENKKVNHEEEEKQVPNNAGAVLPVENGFGQPQFQLEANVEEEEKKMAVEDENDDE